MMIIITMVIRCEILDDASDAETMPVVGVHLGTDYM